MRTTNYLTLSALVLGTVVAGCSGTTITNSTLPTTETGGTNNGGSNTAGGAGVGGAATGGANVGGNATGGANVGGNATGGAGVGGNATGGANVGGNATGGAATGGANVGGNATGGVATGGANVGGNATGGVATGGANVGGNATGGKATGGANVGGNATGGAATGGTPGAATGGSSSCSHAANVLSDFENAQGTSWQVYPVTPASGGAPAGIWYAYLDTTDSCSGQTPTNPANPANVMAGAAPAAALATTDSRYSACDKYAFHSSITNCQYYSGFGASLDPSATVGSTVKSPIDFSNYDGISFWIKSGTGTQGPLYLEFVTEECVPSGDGGTATSTAIDEYNCHGHLLNVSDLSTTWTQKFIPFYTTGSRWFPTASAGGSTQCASGSFCEVPRLDTRHLLALQFSLEDPFNTTPTAYSNYDVWIDDVALYKFSDAPANSGLGTWTQSGANAYPQNKTYAGCVTPKSVDGKTADGKLIQDAYVKWKNNFVKTDGSNLKVVSPEIDSGATVSEGIGYGMMMAVYMGDKALFDGLYGYWNAHIATGTLMNWKIASGGSTSGSGSATDADEDAAFALLEASKQWTSGGYSATTIISDIWSHDIDSGTSLPKGGSNYSSVNPTNPSYFAPAFYKEFAKVDTGHSWSSVVTAVYNALNSGVGNSVTGGLVPAWCTTNCTAVGSNGAATDGEYQYDSHRVPWRIGVDACWNSEAKAATYLSKIIGWFTSTSGANVNSLGLSSLEDIYQTNGTKDTTNGANNSMSMIGCLGVGAMSISSTNGSGGFAERAWQFVLEGEYSSNYTFTNGQGSTKPGTRITTLRSGC